jgi:hypothetical protein
MASRLRCNESDWSNSVKCAKFAPEDEQRRLFQQILKRSAKVRAASK